MMHRLRQESLRAALLSPMTLEMLRSMLLRSSLSQTAQRFAMSSGNFVPSFAMLTCRVRAKLGTGFSESFNAETRSRIPIDLQDFLDVSSPMKHGMEISDTPALPCISLYKA